MGIAQCGRYGLCAEKRIKSDGIPVGSYVWEDGFQLHNEPPGSARSWNECKEIIEKELPLADHFVRDEFCPSRTPNAREAAARLGNEWVLHLNPKIERKGFVLDACGWTQYERNDTGGHNVEPKLALLIKLV
mmetsp:Transcript_8919/g.16891  ORF Transcript_8919/g.16891 Transcript_8919/m.16891 type:complete len:132 (-) Transcript_8919:27-422(-)